MSWKHNFRYFVLGSVEAPRFCPFESRKRGYILGGASFYMNLCPSSVYLLTQFGKKTISRQTRANFSVECRGFKFRHGISKEPENSHQKSGFMLHHRRPAYKFLRFSAYTRALPLTHRSVVKRGGESCMAVAA